MKQMLTPAAAWRLIARRYLSAKPVLSFDWEITRLFDVQWTAYYLTRDVPKHGSLVDGQTHAIMKRQLRAYGPIPPGTDRDEYGLIALLLSEIAKDEQPLHDAASARNEAFKRMYWEHLSNIQHDRARADDARMARGAPTESLGIGGTQLQRSGQEISLA